MEIRVRTLTDRSRFARAMLEASVQKLRGQIGVLERAIPAAIEDEFRRRGGNLNRPDSGARGPRMQGSFTTQVTFNRAFPIRIKIRSTARHAAILNADRSAHTISGNRSGFLAFPSDRSRTGTAVRRSVLWTPGRDFSNYVRVGTERAVRAFLRRF